MDILNLVHVLSACEINGCRAALIKYSCKIGNDTALEFKPVAIATQSVNTEHLRHSIDLQIGAMVIVFSRYEEEDFAQPDSDAKKDVQNIWSAFADFQVFDKGLQYDEVMKLLEANMFPKDRQFQHPLVLKVAECPTLVLFTLADKKIYRLPNGVCGMPFVWKESPDIENAWRSPVAMAVSAEPVQDFKILLDKVNNYRCCAEASGLILSRATRDIFVKSLAFWTSGIPQEQYTELGMMYRDDPS
jgi:hypothetical protein